MNYKIISNENYDQIFYMIDKNEKIRCDKCNCVNLCLNRCWWFTCGKCNNSIIHSIKYYKYNILEDFVNHVLHYETNYNYNYNELV